MSKTRNFLEILSRKLEKAVVECTPRGGSEVNVIFADNTSRVVKLANENQPKEKVFRPKFSDPTVTDFLASIRFHVRLHAKAQAFVTYRVGEDPF